MRESKILKAISYVMIPILIAGILLSLLYGFDKNNYTEKQVDSISYFNTDTFLNDYMTILSKETENLIYRNEKYKYIKDGENTIYYENMYGDISYAYYDINEYKNFKDLYFVIIYKQKVFTNVELTTQTNTLEKLKNYVSQKSEKTKTSNIINGNVVADSEIIATKAIQYFDNFKNTYYTKDLSVTAPEVVIAETEEQIEEIKETEIVDTENETTTKVKEKEQNYVYITTQIQDFQIYTSYKEEVIEEPMTGRTIFYRTFIKSLEKYENLLNYAIPVCSATLMIVVLYIIVSAGHSKGKAGIDLNDFDKIFIEIILLIAIGIVAIILVAMNELLMFSSDLGYKFILSCLITGYLVTNIVVVATGLTILKRLKSKTIFKYSIIGKCFKFIINIIKKIGNKIIKGISIIKQKLSLSLILTLSFIIYFSLMIALVAVLNVFGVIIDVIITSYVIYKVVEKVTALERIERHLKRMYEGNYKIKLEEKDFTKDFEKSITYINDISKGFEKAIQKGIKSERMKTELITNVSHDIKTPLTSIINYVDLLKKEEIQSEKAKEYIEILESKSQRLKKLTEDLVEASKASSGNVKLDMQKLNLTELVKQSIGEFEDKFNEKKLEVVTNYPNQDIYIMADNRYLYRVIENLYANISKYALENSRVYIDVKKENKKVIITIKNISKDSLNISADELMQRFVRGDKSRTTEGSGLGLSISKSLTELQKGKFDLEVDGDLFKVKIEFEII